MGLRERSCGKRWLVRGAGGPCVCVCERGRERESGECVAAERRRRREVRGQPRVRHYELSTRLREPRLPPARIARGRGAV